MVWSWVLSIVGVCGLFFIGKRQWWGWVIAFSNECLWTIYAIVTGQYGFIFGAIAYMTIHAKNAIHWRTSSDQYKS